MSFCLFTFPFCFLSCTDDHDECRAKLAEHGSRYAEQGKKTLGSLFSKVKEQINKFEEQRQINNYNNNFNDDGESR